MARNTSKGLTYFNIDCVEQDNLEYVQLIHGITGYGVLVKLWRRIYQVEGYFCKWDEKTILHFAKKEVDVDIETVKNIVETCIEEGIFSREMLDNYSILTSDGIQKRWLRIATEAKRRDRDIDEKYNLTGILPEFKAKTPEAIAKTPEVIPQSKVKESKEKDVDEIKPPTALFFTIHQAEKALEFTDAFALHATRQTNKDLKALEHLKTKFIEEQKALSKMTWPNENDLKKHFVNWCKKQTTPTGVYVAPKRTVIDHTKTQPHAPNR